MQDFRNLRAWQQAHALTLAIYPVTASFPDEERYGWASRIRRTCSAIPSRIAHGCGCTTDQEFADLIGQALGLASRLEADLLLVRDLGLLNDLDFDPLMEQLINVKRMLVGLHKTLAGDS